MDRHPSLDERDDPAVRIVAYDPAMAAAEIAWVGAGVGLGPPHFVAQPCPPGD